MSSAPEDSTSAKRKKPANMKDLGEAEMTDDEASEVSGGMTILPCIRLTSPAEPCIRPSPTMQPCVRTGHSPGGH